MDKVAFMGSARPFLNPWVIAIIVALLIAQAIVFYFVVWPKLKLLRSAVGTDAKVAAARGMWAALLLRLTALKTAITGFVGSLLLAVPELLEKVGAIDWSGTVLAQYSPLIGIAVIILMTFFHGEGVKKAVEVDPNNPQS